MKPANSNGPTTILRYLGIEVDDALEMAEQTEVKRQRRSAARFGALPPIEKRYVSGERGYSTEASPGIE